VAGAALFLRGDRSALFLDELFVACGDGLWRIASPGKRLWDGAPDLVADDGPVAGEADLVAGVVRPCVPVCGLRGSGRFYPLTRLGEAAVWRLEAAFGGVVQSLGGARGGRAAGATVVLNGLDVAEWPPAGAAVVAVLDAGAGEYVCVCAWPLGGDSREMRFSVPADGFAFAAS
jgi:hypothetical protein